MLIHSLEKPRAARIGVGAQEQNPPQPGAEKLSKMASAAYLHWAPH